MLAQSSPLLQSNNVQNLGCSGEGQLSRDILWNMKEIESTDKRLKDLMKLFHNSTHAQLHIFMPVKKWNHHLSYCEDKTASSILGLHCEY